MSEHPETPEDPLAEPPASPDPIVEWQPTGRRLGGRVSGGVASGGVAGGAISGGAVAVGALAIGALAIGALAIGRLSVGRARFKVLEIDQLIVGRIDRKR